MKQSIKVKFILTIYSLFTPTLIFSATDEVFTMPWWGWPAALFFTTFFIGIFGVLAGIGGGVLFVPLASSFFPFHIDFVRGTGLFIALGSSLAAAPHLLGKNLASIKLALPTALVASAFAVVGAFFGLWLSALNPAYIQGSLGVTIIGIVFIMLFAKDSEHPSVAGGNYLGTNASYRRDISRRNYRKRSKLDSSQHRERFILFCFCRIIGWYFRTWCRLGKCADIEHKHGCTG
ncbi:MAG: hypothetical protein Ct9H300mP28_01290 [Pseudomonadota bacterium]|nr:MAG: hypothetical protein Ct9H300mP28_01290 [Pseudomonadota bacterium]